MTLRWNWGWGIALVYTLFASGTVGFACYAMSQHVDLVSDDYYAESLALDGRLAAIDRVAALGDTFSIRVDREGRRVTIAWPGAMAAAAQGTVTLYRPSDAAADRVVPIAADEAGRQQVALDGLRSGHWVVQVRWQYRGQAFYAERPVVVP